MLCLTLLLIHLAVSMSSSSPDRHLPRCIVGSGEVVVLVVVCRMAGVVLLVASRCMWMMKNSGEGGWGRECIQGGGSGGGRWVYWSGTDSVARA